jgi:hypothetical protein
LLECTRNIGLPGDVHGKEQSFAAILSDAGCDGLAKLHRAAGDHHPGAFDGATARDRLADAAGGPGDQDDLSVEPPGRP